MSKLLLLSIALTLSMITGKAGATTLTDEYQKPQHYGIFKFHVDEYDKFTITRAQ